MKRAKILPILLLVIAFAISTIACSKGKSPVEPVINDANDISQDTPLSLGTESDNRSVLCVYDCVIDPDAKTFTIEPANRSAEYHFPLTQRYPNVLQITGYGWTPNFWADIKLTHPLPGSGIDGFDARVIAILPANPGVSMDYPTFNVLANNSVILEPDGYTKLFDWIAPSITGNANPFVAYFKDEPYRVWSSTGLREETQRWQMNIAGFGGPLQFRLVVDVSTNYPDPPQPVTDNAAEPINISCIPDGNLTTDGGNIDIYALITDWQGILNIGGVFVEAPDLFNGLVNLEYEAPGPDPNQYIFVGNISNEKLASQDYYNILISTWDQPTNIKLYNEFRVFVEKIIDFEPVDVTPPWLNFSPKDIFIEENFAYVAGGVNGLHIFDISNPLNPIWLNWIDTPNQAKAVYVNDGYAYVADYHSGLQIIDVDPPEYAHIVKSLNTPQYNVNKVYISNNYAYVLESSEDYSGLIVINIETPESAFTVKSIETPGGASGVHVSGNYAFVSDGDSGLQIIDVSNPASAYIMKTIDTPDYAYAVTVSDGFAYIADGYSGLQIIDVDPPASASIVKSVDTPGNAIDINVNDNYAYIADYDAGLQVIYVGLPSLAHIVKTVDTIGDVFCVDVTDDYSFVVDHDFGFHLIDITQPETAYVAKSVYTPCNAHGICISDGYAFIADSEKFLIIDINPLESTNVVNSIIINANKVQISDGYAYVVGGNSGLQIIDIEPPESAYIVNSIDIPGYSPDVQISGDYAYVANHDSGLQIINIEPPESAFIAKTVETPGWAFGVYVAGGFAYVADNAEGMQIIDIDPPESAHIVKSIDTPGYALDVGVSFGYACVAASGRIYIIDIDPFESAYIVNSVHLPGYAAREVYVSGGYVYVADDSEGLQILDIYPPESAHILNSVDTPGVAYGLHILEGYAYVADGGLRVIELW